MKKLNILTPILLTIVLTLASITGVSAQEPPPPTLYVEAPTSVPVSTEFDILIWILDIEEGFSITEINLRVSFDDDDLEYISDEFLDPDGAGGWGGGGSLVWFGLWEGVAGGSSSAEERAWFRITFHCLQAGPTTITVSAPLTAGGIELNVIYDTEPDPVSVTVKQGNPVGGVFYSTNKIGLFSPWIAAISIIGCITIVSILVRKRRA